MTPPRISLLTAALFIVFLFAEPVGATPPGGAVFGSYWQEFIDFWRGVFQKQNGVVMGVLGVGAVALFIITRGKWRK
jgi:hypothetical protein